MHFMNESDIEMAEQRATNPVVKKAVRFLKRLVDLVNENSDGWAYWRAPVDACDKLFTLIERSQMRNGENGVEPTEADLKAAMVPIKSFFTRHNNKQAERGQPPLVMPSLEDGYTRRQINDLLTARIVALDDSEVVKVVNFLFGGEIKLTKEGDLFVKAA